LRPPASPMQEPVLLGGAVRGVRGVFPLLHVAPADKQWGHGIYAVPNRLEWNPAILEDAQGIRQGVALRPPASPMQEPVLLGGAVRGVRGVFPLLHVAPADKQWGTAFMRCPTA
jgi:hypothetical protein